MQKIFINKVNHSLLFLLLVAISVSSIFTACNNEDDVNNTVELFSYGPMPIARGAELRFIGNLLDQVTSIKLPGGIEIPASEFGTHTSGLVTITVPQNAVEGYVTLVHPNGEIVTKTPMGFSEPIVLSSYTPATAKAGDEITITGDYLNLIGQVLFTDRVSVDSTLFISQSRTEIKLLLPDAAQTGKIAISNGAADPIIIYSESDMTVTLPAITSFSPNPVKAGTDLTITGTDLDLVKSVIFGGDKSVALFTNQTATSITVTVPINAEDGMIKLVPASMVEVESADILVMTVPTVSNLNPASVKNGGTITITGTNLDLINKAVFGSSAEGTIQAGGTSSSITVSVPNTAVTGALVLSTTSNKTVAGGNVTIIAPSITGFAPASGKANTDVVINGNNLDVVSSVKFTGGNIGTIVSNTGTVLTVTVPIGAQTGKITLVAINGVEVSTATDYTVNANLPNFTSFSESRGEQGKILTLNGTNMDLIKTLIFPGNITATEYGLKSATQVQVYVPLDVPVGYGQIKMLTYEGEEGLLPTLYFGTVSPVVDQAYVFFNFNGTGKDSWWGNAMGSGPGSGAPTADGTPYWNINGTCGTGYWDGLFWRNGGNNIVTTGLLVNRDVVKFDVNIREAITTGELKLNIRGADFDKNLIYNPWNGVPGGYKTEGWITVSFPLTVFGISDAQLQGITGDFGMVWSSGTAITINMGIDNVRFEKVP